MPTKKSSVNCHCESDKEMSISDVIANTEASMSKSVLEAQFETRALSEDENSLEARLKRALPTEMQARIVKALQGTAPQTR